MEACPQFLDYPLHVRKSRENVQQNGNINIENNKEWDYSERSIYWSPSKRNRQDKKDNACTIKKRATLVLKKKTLDEWDDECFGDFVDVLPESETAAIKDCFR